MLAKFRCILQTNRTFSLSSRVCAAFSCTAFLLLLHFICNLNWHHASKYLAPVQPMACPVIHFREPAPGVNHGKLIAVATAAIALFSLWRGKKAAEAKRREALGEDGKPLLRAPRLDEVRQAAKQLAARKQAVRTPLVKLNAAALPELKDKPELEIWLKLETLQPVGSFKVRGAGAAIAKLLESGVAPLLKH